MIRFISFLLGKPYDPCKSCETLKEQITYERDENKRLIETLLSIVKPKEVEAAAPIEINEIKQSSAMFSRRRAALEEKDRESARILAEKRFVATPDDRIAKLEHELGIEEEKNG